MRITKRQLRRVIRETLLREDLNAFLKKHASASKSIDDATKNALADEERPADVDDEGLSDAMEDYYDEMMGV